MKHPIGLPQKVVGAKAAKTGMLFMTAQTIHFFMINHYEPQILRARDEDQRPNGRAKESAAIATDSCEDVSGEECEDPAMCECGVVA